MTEAEGLIAQDLTDVKAQISRLTADVSQHQVKAYQAYSWFTEDQVAQMKQGLAETKKNKTANWEDSFRPLEHQYNNLDVTEHPELMEDVEWQVQTYRGDVNAYSQADVGIMIYDPAHPDDGVAYEAAAMHTLGKPVVLAIPDDCTTPMNLMLAHGVTAVIRISELSTYDFNKCLLETYHGKIF